MTYLNLGREWNSDKLRTSYTAFLLRCWQEETDGEPAWRFTLVQVGDKGSMQGFASLEDVTTHLRLALADRARTSNQTIFSTQNKA